MDGSVSVLVTGHDLDALRAEPGQFFRWRFLDRRSWWEAHPFSLSHAPNGQWLRMTAKPLGDHTASLKALQVGTPVLLEGPYGAITPRVARHRRFLFVAAGSGAAPLVALAQSAAATGVPVTFIYRVRHEADVCFLEELDELRQLHNVNVHIVVGGGIPADVRRFMGSELATLLRQSPVPDVYLCGPDGFVRDVARLARTSGLSRTRVPRELCMVTLRRPLAAAALTVALLTTLLRFELHVQTAHVAMSQQQPTAPVRPAPPSTPEPHKAALRHKPATGHGVAVRHTRPRVTTTTTAAAAAAPAAGRRVRGAHPSPHPSARPTSPPPTVSGTFTGPAESTPYGDVQVQIKVANGRITDVLAPQLPSDNRRSRQISAQAGPQLRQEALDAQSANIDDVSGATYTSDSYKQSLQAAIDQAHLH